MSQSDENAGSGQEITPGETAPQESASGTAPEMLARWESRDRPRRIGDALHRYIEECFREHGTPGPRLDHFVEALATFIDHRIEEKLAVHRWTLHRAGPEDVPEVSDPRGQPENPRG